MVSEVAAFGLHNARLEPVPTALPPADRAARGKAARAGAPRGSHAGFQPASDRPDPVSLLESQAASRVPELLPIRYGRMLASPFAFFRGGALLMASDLAATPVSGLTVQVCGDAHLANFGMFASPERRLVFDINDFDETLPGPWEWDVKRLAASAEVAARGNDFHRKQRREIVVAAVARYRQTMRRLARMGEVEAWQSPAEVDELKQHYQAILSRPERRLADADLDRARDRAGLHSLDKLIHWVPGQPVQPARAVKAARAAKAGKAGKAREGAESGRAGKAREGAESGKAGELRFVTDPPLLVPVVDLPEPEPANGLEAHLNGILANYRRTLEWDRRFLLGKYQVADMARKVVGIGSVGMRCWVILLTGRGQDDRLFLQVKEAVPSVLSGFIGASPYPSQGERVVAGQRLMQAAGDVFLGWHPTRSVLAHDYYVRQLRDWKFSLAAEDMGPAVMRTYAELCGQTLARAHARSGDRVAIAAYLGKSSVFENAVADFAADYADQNERDHASLAAAVESGRVEAQRGV